ncbi:hypothetical protein D3C87_1835970 [compost metagenome]
MRDVHSQPFFSVITIEVSVILIHNGNNVSFIGGEINYLRMLRLQLVIGDAG